MSQPASQPPQAEVLRAFAAVGPPRRLSGGQGCTWRVGDVVLKPLDMTEEALRWQAEVLSQDLGTDVRVAAPLRTADGDLVSHGWTGWPYLEGRTQPRRWPDVIQAGRRFHAALRHEPEPAFVRSRADHWAEGDRAAWDPATLDRYAQVRHIPTLRPLLRPLSARAQVVHGDLTGNVLLHRSLPPAVIDVSPYWRPAEFGSAIVVADALVWEGADRSLLRVVRDVPDFGQYLVRALICRLVTDSLFTAGSPPAGPGDDPYSPAVALAVTVVEQGR